MKYLVDVNVLSEPTKPVSLQRVADWLQANRNDTVVDAVVLAEIWRGVDALPKGQRMELLTAWFLNLKAKLPCLDWTPETAMKWGPLVNQVKGAGFTIEIKDTMIAATAKLHGLTVATRNVDDFTRCGVPVVNPFE
jgi:predicted nucleic acid-binding protein